MDDSNEARTYAQSIVDSVRDSLIVLDQKLRVVFANKSFYNKFLVTKEDTENRLIYELGNGQWNIPELISALQEIILQNSSFDNYEVTYCFEKIGTRTMLLNGRKMDQQVGGQNLILLSVEDITNRKNNLKLTNDREKYQKRRRLFYAQWITDNSPNLIAFFSTDGRYLFANEKMGTVAGQTPSNMIGKKFGSFGCSDMAGQLFNAFDNVKETGDKLTIELKHRETIYRTLIIPDKNSSGKITFFATYSMDVTDLKRIGEALRDNEERFRLLVTASADIIYRMSPDWSEMWELHGSGFFADTKKPDRFWLQKYIHSEDQPKVLETISKAVRTRSTFELEHRIIRLDGTLAWTLSRAVPRLNANGDVIEWFGAASDTTERKTLEEKLRYERELLGTIIDNIPVIIRLYDPKTMKFEFNKAFHEITGWTDKDLQKHDFLELVYPDENYRKTALEFINSLTPGFRDFKMVCKNGKQIDSSWAHIRIPDGRQVGIGIDISERKHAFEQLQKHQAEIEGILNSIPDGYVIYNKDGSVKGINDFGFKLMGFPMETLKLGYKERYNIIYPFYSDNRKIPMEQLPSYRALRGELVRGVIMKTSNKYGDFWVSASASPIFVDGKTVGAIAEFADITELHKLQEQITYERNFIDAVLHTSSALIIILDTNARFVRFNRACEELTGCSKDDVINKSIFDLFTTDDERPGLEKTFKKLMSGEKSIEYENHWPTKSGEKRFIRWRNSVLFNGNGEVEFLISAGIDITDHRRLEDELAYRAEELAAANKDLESFSFSVAHDLRNPLKTIGGFATLLTEDCYNLLNDECKDFIDRIRSGVNRMNSIIDDILALSRISRQEIKSADIDLSEMARLSIDEQKASNPDRKVEIKIQNGIKVKADPRLMSVALGNLLNNAWKYTSKVEHPVIEFGSFKKDGQNIYFVKDNGAGFDMAHADRLFKPFQRLHSDKEFAGTGVGLAIVERAVNRHGGQIWAESEPGKGAAFYFTLNKRHDK